ncbi:hydrophobic seed protein-like [Abrus precatorius]|uniref:Hydrophobic seed protein-like n=1 Tax=Abrus precatorius TaxID=3816 RepID=A0A8B8K3J6_ABRPR|nr:hydrophobic seed protein-like [Abrus precatorius]
MGSKAATSIALLISINLLFFSMVSSIATNPTPSRPPPPPPVSVPPSPTDCSSVDVCINLLGGLLGNSSTDQCCTVIAGLLDLSAYACICARLQVLGIPISLFLELYVNSCGGEMPNNFSCN